MDPVTMFSPGDFEPEQHFYPRVLNAQLHPLVRFFLSLGNERIAERYCHLHPEASPAAVRSVLARQSRHLRWGGADLFHATTDRGERRLVVIETNSCPSGQKSMPRFDEVDEHAGYRSLLERAFLPLTRRRGLPKGGLAVLYDKNPMENTGYAATLAELTGEDVALVYQPADDPAPSARFDDGVLQIREGGRWRPIRAALRYVTQRPWTRLPPVCRTELFNPVLACLAGGRNKLLAAKAYDIHNARLRSGGLQLWTPETIWDVALKEVPIWVQRMGGIAVVKDPYSNAGQGVWTITSEAELEAFMEAPHRYDRYIVQALIGNVRWSSEGRSGRLYHVGTMPNKRHQIFAADLRCMIGVGPEGAFPVAIYARRARSPLTPDLDEGASSWDMLGTNLSIKDSDGQWSTESERLMLMDQRDFNKLGVGIDDLIEAYLQTTMAVAAIDEMAQTLVTRRGRFRDRFFLSINPDAALAREIHS